MAIEQDWAAYADQTYLDLVDTLLARTSGGAGVEFSGQQLFARRSSGVFSAVGTAAGGAVAAAIVNTSGTAGSYSCLSFDPGNGGLGFRDSQIRSTNNGSNATTLEFLVANGAPPVEAARITPSGNFAFGTTDDNINSGIGTKIRTGGTVSAVSTANVNGTICYSMYSTVAAAYRFYVGYGGQIYATSTSISAISDARLKENIRDLDYGLATILRLRPRRFDWKAGKGKDCADDTGFIAQEFEEVLPEFIDSWRGSPDDPTDLKSVRAGELIPILVNAIQELAARVKVLESAR